MRGALDHHDDVDVAFVRLAAARANTKSNIDNDTYSFDVGCGVRRDRSFILPYSSYSQSYSQPHSCERCANARFAVCKQTATVVVNISVYARLGIAAKTDGRDTFVHAYIR